MTKFNNEEIFLQKNQVSCKENFVKLVESCGLNNGILSFSKENKQLFIEQFEDAKIVPAFFIPASGSGSRMYKFLYKWKSTKIVDGDMKCFIAYFNDSAISFDLNIKIVDDLSNLEEVVDIVLSDDKGYTSLPKGLFPFHLYDNKTKTPFEEHLIQINQFNSLSPVHFTIQAIYADRIKSKIDALRLPNQISFSEQSTKSDAYCFDKDNNLVEGIRRPAGHGALLENLNNLNADYIIVKNIDNVQYSAKAVETQDSFKFSLGLLVDFKKDAQKLLSEFSPKAFKEFNSKFGVFAEEQISFLTEEEVRETLNRPSRVCGMVKNTGAPGGGPFWINDRGLVSKQIIESSQISPKQQEIMKTATHFNPVFLALSKTDLSGNVLDLSNYVDNKKFFIVEKDHQGKKIFYRELPGLWNGSMNDWNTLFIELESSIFSPVKSILDLQDDLHNS